MHFKYSLLILILLSEIHLVADVRPRIIIETDAGGDPDDEQSLVRFLLYSNDFDVVGIIANRPHARPGENLNPVRDGLGIVRRMIDAYAECYSHLVLHDSRYPMAETLYERTVAGYDDAEEGVQLVLNAVESDDPRPIWFCNWGTDAESGTSCLKRALDRVLLEHGQIGYSRFKNRIRLSSDDKFGKHTSDISPPFPLWVDPFRPERDGKRWYHRFSSLTARAGGFDIHRDAKEQHGPLGALYPLNTTHPQKEGDSMTFLYLLPAGLAEPEQPSWGSWGGRHLPNNNYPGKPYYWASAEDAWKGKTNRDNILFRWAIDLQNDFRSRLDWCVKNYDEANHAPFVRMNGISEQNVMYREVRGGEMLAFDASESSDPDGDHLTFEWFAYPEAGTCRTPLDLGSADRNRIEIVFPVVAGIETAHVVLRIRDNGEPPLCSFRRIVVTISP